MKKSPYKRGIIFKKYKPMHSTVLGLESGHTILGISKDQVLLNKSSIGMICLSLRTICKDDSPPHHSDSRQSSQSINWKPSHHIRHFF